MVKVIEGYILNQAIGQGNFGLVYRATHKQKPGVYAVKVIPIEKFQQNEKLQIYTNNQIEALQTVGVSEYIIRFYQMIKSKNNWYLVYEYCNGGTLMNILKRQQRLDQKKSLLIFKQLLQAFKVLNKNNIMHRDLKPENIFFTSTNGQQTQSNSNDKKKVKLGDFGFCKGLKPDQNLAKTMLGSPIYMAPEVLKGQSYTTKADIWSLGVILFQMLYGFCPFQSNSIANLISTIDTQQVQLPNNIQVSQKTQNLIKRMLSKDYFRRIGWVQLFGLRIDQNGEYVEQQVGSTEQRGSTPNSKKFSALFGSLNLQIGPSLIPNNKSYSTIRDDESSQLGKKLQVRFISKRQIQQPKANQYQGRVSSQPKDQKRFYSQNYLNILSTPLQKKKQQQDNKSSNDRKKLTLNISSQKNGNSIKANQNKNSSPLSANVPTVSPPPPLAFRQERIVSMDNIDLIKKQNLNMNSFVGANNQNLTGSTNQAITPMMISNSQNLSPLLLANVNSSSASTMSKEPIPFQKYRQNIGMPNNLSTRLLSERSIREPSKTMAVNASNSLGSQPSQLETKRSNLLKIHENISKSLFKTMSILQQKVCSYKATKQLMDYCSVKQVLQDCYIVLKLVQQRLKTINESIKITQTCLLDLATIVNHQHIQVQKFIIQLRNQLMRCSMQLPNMPANKATRIENMNSFKELIKTKQLGQIIDEHFY